MDKIQGHFQKLETSTQKGQREGTSLGGSFWGLLKTWVSGSFGLKFHRCKVASLTSKYECCFLCAEPFNITYGLGVVSFLEAGCLDCPDLTTAPPATTPCWRSSEPPALFRASTILHSLSDEFAQVEQHGSRLFICLHTSSSAHSGCLLRSRSASCNLGGEKRLLSAQLVSLVAVGNWFPPLFPLEFT